MTAARYCGVKVVHLLRCIRHRPAEILESALAVSGLGSMRGVAERSSVQDIVSNNKRVALKVHCENPSAGDGLAIGEQCSRNKPGRRAPTASAGFAPLRGRKTPWVSWVTTHRRNRLTSTLRRASVPLSPGFRPPRLTTDT